MSTIAVAVTPTLPAAVVVAPSSVAVGTYTPPATVAGVGVQGPAGPAGTVNFAHDIAGVIDGANRTFTLEHSPVELFLFLNGISQSAAGDYSITANTITMNIAPGIVNGSDTLSTLYFY